LLFDRCNFLASNISMESGKSQTNLLFPIAWVNIVLDITYITSMAIAQLFLKLSNYIDINSASFSESGVNLFQDIHLLHNLDFNETGLQLKQLIEGTYRSGITGLEDVQVEGENITGIFLDQVSPGLTQRFQFTITPKNISYRKILPGNGDSSGTEYSEWLNFSKPTTKIHKQSNKELGGEAVTDKSGRTKYCTPGKTFACGKRCIAIGKECKDTLSQPQQQLQKEVVATGIGKDGNEKKQRGSKVKQPKSTGTPVLNNQQQELDRKGYVSKNSDAPEQLTDAEDRKNRIVNYLRIKPTSHGTIDNFLISIPESERAVISKERRKQIADSLEEFGTNIVPITVRRTEDEKQPYEVIHGSDWLQVAQEKGIEKPWVWVFDMDDAKAKQYRQAMHELYIGDTPPMGATTKQSRKRKTKQATQTDQLTTVEKNPGERLSSPTTAIKSSDEFKSVALEVYDKLNQNYNLDDLVPIYRIRREIGDRISREHFNAWLLEMQANDILQLMTGEIPDFTPDKREDSIHIPGAGLRSYAKRLSVDKQTKGESTIREYKDFKPQLIDTWERLNKENANYRGLVPIWHLRDQFKGRVNDSDFNNWLMEAQSNKLLYLQSGEARGATEDQKRKGINSDIRGLLFYASKPEDDDKTSGGSDARNTQGLSSPTKDDTPVTKSGQTSKKKLNTEGEVKITDKDDYGKVGIKGVPSLEGVRTTPEDAKFLVEHHTSPMKGSQTELGEAYKLRDGKPIKTYADFESNLRKAIDTLRSGDLVEIYKLRRSLGDRLSRQQFDDYLSQSRDKGLFNLTDGEFRHDRGTMEDSYHLRTLGVKRTYVQLNPEYSQDTSTSNTKAAGRTLNPRASDITEVPNITIKDSPSSIEGARYLNTDVSTLTGAAKTNAVSKKLGDQIASDGGKLATPIVVINKKFGKGILGIGDHIVAKDPHNEMLASAAVEAKKQNPRAAEMISTYLVGSQEEANAVLYQRNIAGKFGKETPSVKDADFKMIDVKSIVGGVKPPSLDEDTVEKIAQSQLKVGNVLPLVLREVGLEKFEVVSGDAAIVAGRRAREIDPRRGEMINAFVVPRSKASQ
jgi:hypothetical protein